MAKSEEPKRGPNQARKQAQGRPPAARGTGKRKTAAARTTPATKAAAAKAAAAPGAQPASHPAPEHSPTRIPVVGLAGSAGAFDCFKTFFENMPPDSGAAFVVIQHLAPAHESMLPELLARHTRMRVVQASNAQRIEPDTVYVIPPNEYLGIRGGSLYLAEPVKLDGLRMPIDFFFSSLAEDRQERGIAVLFSGTGSDGTRGMRAIREGGGLTIVQDPLTAQYADMPRSAIATRVVDAVLPPEQIPRAVAEFLRQPYVRGQRPAFAEAEGKHGGLPGILSIVLAHTGSDFRHYKKNTVLRRIERRMGLHHLSHLSEYETLLREDPHEVKLLLKDLLINVTSFFRDSEAFEELRVKIIAPMIRARPPDEPIRIWVAGCSSGEEAYSIVMLLLEEMSAARKTCPIQVFATDIDEEALEIARRGVYAESVVADVGPERLAKFFLRRDKDYQVTDALRNSTTFACQNLLTDPPFSKMGLISCRNLLIYLDAEMQNKLIRLFSFALNPDGCLFLGKSEGINGQSELFSAVSTQARIYRRRSHARAVVLDWPIAAGKKRLTPTGPPPERPRPAVTYTDVIRQALLTHFAASVVLTDKKGQILQFHGQTGKYLELPAAEPHLNLREIAKPGLAMRLRSAMHTAVAKGKPVVLEQVPVGTEKTPPFARVTVIPFGPRGETEPLLAVIFEDVPRPALPEAETVPGDAGDTVVQQLEDELRATQFELQSSIEELQAANEELRVSNEEIVSTNEELQSTNEELETSKEELQSVNEELTTVNSQLQEKVERLDAANNDMANLLRSTKITTLFLDADLHIKLFSAATGKVLSMIPADVGRPITDLSVSFVDFDLVAAARAVAAGADAIEREVRHVDGAIFLVRVMPYHLKNERLSGVVITLDDVTSQRRAEQRVRALAAVVEGSSDAVIIFDAEGAIKTWSLGAQRMYGWSEQEALQKNIRDLAPEPEQVEKIAGMVWHLMAGETIPAFETRRRAKSGGVLDVWVTIVAVRDAADKVTAIATIERDVTERKQAEEALRQASEELERSNKELEQFASIASHDLQEPLRMISGFLKLLDARYSAQLDEKAKEYVHFAVEGATRMSQLINDLLAYSRISNFDKAPKPVDANRPLAAALANLQDQIRGAKATVTHGTLPTVLADSTHLTQIFQNLVGNAVKFCSPERPCRVEIGAEPSDGAWRFSVRDNGIGIAPEQLERVFVLFKRLHVRDKYPGTGIGLAICKKIIERLGGRIWAESTPGVGSTFFFTLKAP